jgi:hypothetical protein
MWWILQTIAISIIIIYIAHHVVQVLKNNYTIPKTKDIVGFQTKRYREMLQEVLENRDFGEPSSHIDANNFLGEDEKRNMHDDLLQFMEQNA